ncbi:hypothetical protein GCM10023211_23610 [Orbus sasakiae]|uniref:Uncharacterized protein n=1 Tax=Orbus sasakiae TaxID=1078475 RepID=A0ABP9NC18_9GAMM
MATIIITFAAKNRLFVIKKNIIISEQHIIETIDNEINDVRIAKIVAKFKIPFDKKYAAGTSTNIE